MQQTSKELGQGVYSCVAFWDHLHLLLLLWMINLNNQNLLMVHNTVFTDSGFWSNCGDFHDRIISVINTLLSGVFKIVANQYWFSAFSIAQRAFSRFPFWCILDSLWFYAEEQYSEILYFYTPSYYWPLVNNNCIGLISSYSWFFLVPLTPAFVTPIPTFVRHSKWANNFWK